MSLYIYTLIYIHCKKDVYVKQYLIVRRVNDHYENAEC